jgi:hypothetical protein
MNRPGGVALGFGSRGSSTQRALVWEISINGQASANSSPTFMILARDSTVATATNSNGTGQTDDALRVHLIECPLPAGADLVYGYIRLHTMRNLPRRG